MDKKDLEYFKLRLQQEKDQLEEELAGVAQKSDSAPGGWQASTGNLQIDSADENEVADKLEELEDNSGITTQLENQLNEVKDALERINKNTYGLCEVCGKPIERDRLEANPSARNSIKHGHK